MEKKHKVAQHTPGPWETSRNGRDWVVCEGGAGDMICDLAGCGNDKHNARLIAAAPELLAALENARNVLAGLASGDLKAITADSPALAQVRAAIAKATQS